MKTSEIDLTKIELPLSEDMYNVLSDLKFNSIVLWQNFPNNLKREYSKLAAEIRDRDPKQQERIKNRDTMHQ